MRKRVGPVIDLTPVGLHMTAPPLAGLAVIGHGVSQPLVAVSKPYKSSFSEHPPLLPTPAEQEHRGVDIAELEAELARLRAEQRRLETNRLRDRVLALRAESMVALRDAEHPAPAPPVRERPWRAVSSPTPAAVRVAQLHTVEDVLSKAESYLVTHRANHPPAAGPFSPVRAAPPPPLGLSSMGWSAPRVESPGGFRHASSFDTAETASPDRWPRFPPPARSSFESDEGLADDGGASPLPSETLPPAVSTPKRAALEEVSST